MPCSVPAVVVLLLLVGGCTEQPAVAGARDGTLVLELGGAGRSLGEELRRLGVQLHELPPAAAPEPAASTAGSDAGNDDGDESTSASAGAPPSSTDSGPAEVVLQKGQTLFALAKQYLGSASRFHELLEVNGLTEQQARKLQPGTRLRLPNGSKVGK